MSATVFISTNSFTILVLRVLNFSSVFDHNRTFCELILFPCQIIILLTRPIKIMHCREKCTTLKKGASGYVNCFC